MQSGAIQSVVACRMTGRYLPSVLAQGLLAGPPVFVRSRAFTLRLLRKETGGSALKTSWFVEIIARLLRPKPRQLAGTISNLNNSNPSGI